MGNRLCGVKRTLACALFAALCVLFSASPALAEQPGARTPDLVRERLNGILSGDERMQQVPFAEMVDFDDAGGFDFCTLEGERRLTLGDTSAFLRGRIDENGRMDEIVLIMQPQNLFGRAYSMQADRLSRACIISLFEDLSESELTFLMDSYLYDIRPYRYSEGDEHAPQRVRMCEIELQDEVVRIDSEAAQENALMLSVTFLYDADEVTRERAQENGWRIRRLSQAASECQMIRTCGECLLEFDKAELEDSLADIEALLELAEISADAIAQMQTEHMHAQEVFLKDLQKICAQMTGLIGDFREACGKDDMDNAWLRLQEICGVSSVIGGLPETLY